MRELFYASLASLFARQESSDPLDYNAAPPNLSTLANNSIFETWRPKAHVLPPMNHIGDPCMQYVDPSTGLFHIGYLYSSDDTSGAAGATTADLVTYRDVRPDVPVFIEPGGINDPIAVFDGSVIPVGINGTPTLLYTSVSYLPIHWTIPYTKGSETQSLAVSYDGGSNFTKVSEGPVIPGAPYGSIALNVTGFRDPYVFQSPELDRTLVSKNGTWYAAVSGGVHDIGPSQFLYRQHSADFRDWEYLGEWWKEPANSTWGDGVFAGRWGFNFEVANIFNLDSAGYDDEGEFFMTLGTEWGYAPVAPQTSPERNMLWASGSIEKSAKGQVQFHPNMAGRLDWGRSTYAAAGKLVPATSEASKKSSAGGRFIIYLWLTNDGFGSTDFPVDQQGWDGALTTPRELSIGTIHDVVNNHLVSETGSWRIKRTNSGDQSATFDLVTLKQTIAREALNAYTQNATRSFSQAGRTISNDDNLDISESPQSKFFLLKSCIHFPSSARGNESDVKAGFKILSSEQESTTIYYQFSNESLIIDRSNSSAAASTTPGIVTSTESGRLRLFDIQDEADPSSPRIETLEIMILVDNAIVEVYVNDRFALSTWIWSWYAASNRISYFYGGDSEVRFAETMIWEGLVDAWPERTR